MHRRPFKYYFNFSKITNLLIYLIYLYIQFLYRVQTLKENIEKLHGLPVSNQVLLISGGDILQPGSRVCSYSSGTDTNPIFMFITSFVDSKILPQPWPSIEPGNLY